MFKYPADSSDDKYALLARRGDFWTNSHGDAELVADIFHARALEENQARQNFQELVGLAGRKQAPVLHTELWYRLAITETELLRHPLAYGEGAQYGAGGYVYGSQVTNTRPQYRLPASLVEIPALLDLPANGRQIWLAGIDYSLSDGVITFYRSPFDAEFRVEQTAEGVRTVYLWLPNSRWDLRYLYLWYGYLLGSEQASSETYKLFLNDVLDGFNQGSSHKLLTRVLADIVGTPTAQGSETVLELTADRRGQLVISDLSVYRGPAAATAVVAVGDSLTDGEPIFDAITWHELSAGVVPPVALLQLEKDLLPETYAGGLAFPNRDVPLVVSGTVDGKTKVEFELAGYPNDVRLFFADLHERALTRGLPTLAESLDTRGLGAPSQPTAASLPAVINPCEFLVQNVLRFNFLFARIKLASAENGLDFSAAAILRKLVPPWAQLLLSIDLPDFTEAVGPANCSETLELYSAADGFETTMGPDNVSESLTLRYLESLCG